MQFRFKFQAFCYICLIPAILIIGSMHVAHAQEQPLDPYRVFLSIVAGEGNAVEPSPLPDHANSSVQYQSAQLQFMSNVLIANAETDGSVKMIVELQLPTAYQSEDLLSSNAVAQQRAIIDNVQQQFIDDNTAQSIEVYTTYATVPYVALEVGADDVAALLQSPLIVNAQEDIMLTTTLADSTEIIGAPRAWDAGFEGENQAIVIVDTGIDADHSFFGNRVVAEACFSTGGGRAGIVSLCPNGNSEQIGSGSADATIASCDGGDLCFHGTHVAGIAAGSSTTFNGVAPKADIIAIQTFSRIDDRSTCLLFFGQDPPCATAFTSDLIRSLEHVGQLAETHSIASVNFSLGGNMYSDQAICDSENALLKAQIDALRAKGIATIASSGNNGWKNALGTPACISSAIAVGATTNSDAVANFSNMHDMVDLLAPGVRTNSSMPGGSFTRLSGTSMSAPHVAGAWAVLKAASPTDSVDMLLNKTRNSGKSTRDSRTGGLHTKPRIQLDEALDIPNQQQLPDLEPQNVTFDARCSATVSFTNSGEANISSNSRIVVRYAQGSQGSAITVGSFGAIVGTTGSRIIPFPANSFGDAITVDLNPENDPLNPNPIAEVTRDNNVKVFAVPAACQNDEPTGTGTFVGTVQNLGDRNSLGVTMADFDNDGDLDAAVGNYLQDAAIWMNDGTGTFTLNQSLDTDDGIAVDAADFDNDGDVDLVFAENSGPITVWTNNGSGIFSDSGQALGYSNNLDVAVGDVDGDTDVDIIASSNGGNQIWQNDGNGTFSAGPSLGSSSSWGVDLGDIDGDGDLDIYFANAGANKVWVNDGTGAFTNQQSLGSSTGRNVTLGDVDGDGDLDAAVINTPNQVNKIWLNNGSGVFSDSLNNLGTLNGSLVLGDWDGDNVLDAFIANSNGSNQVWMNNGTGVFTNSGQSLGSSRSSDVAVGDVDGDNDLDVFVANQQGQANKVWLNQ